MRTATTCTFLAVLFACAAPRAQTPDTTEAWRYLSLEIGNVWEYESSFSCQGCGGDEVLGYWRWTVERDSSVGGVEYVVVREEQFTPEGLPESDGVRDRLVRFDTLEARAVEYFESYGEAPWPAGFPCRLDTPFNGEPECGEYDGKYIEMWGGYDEEVYVNGDLVITAAKGYVSLASGIGFAADIGFFYYGGGKLDKVWEDRLMYARIGDMEYGTRVPVSAEEPAASVSTVSLAVFPNPTRDSATLSLTLDRPQQVALAVYDVLGRRVLAGDLGAHAAGEASHRLDMAGLPAGVYVVRLDGDDGASTTARVVRQ